ncbi:hypothetical protein [Paenibacillus mendelii]|uniref:Uncharacterized protein n=1 Tax=Paenibacillus mendelii TaxID=206163 RepID=A0ABV6JL68_9BACL|nr:hypothetical protein [Paenibacillus mendelii]MCQ6562327.1 hypothetical protein [Paenibacillus mendelii]
MIVLRKICSITVIAAVVAAAAPTGAVRAADLKTPYNDQFGHYHTVFKKGPSIPNLDTFYVPQGMAYWPDKQWILIAYYYYDPDFASLKKNSLVAVVDQRTGKHIKNLYLADEMKEGDIYHAGHVGGLAVSKSYLWIASSAESSDSKYNMLRYKLTDIEKTSANGRLSLDEGFKLKASSYATYADGDLWVGKFDAKNTAAMHRYNLNSSETPRANPLKTYKTPKQIQGVAITGKHIIYSQSSGRKNPSNLRMYNKSEPSKLQDSMTLPNMSQGLAIAGSNLYINFESGAKAYLFGGTYVKKTLSYGKLGFIIPDYWKKIYGQETNYAPYQGYMRSWTESDASDDLRVELEGIQYSAAAARAINSSKLHPSISFNGNDYLDNDSWDYTYTNFPNPEFDNFDKDPGGKGDGVDNDDIVQVTAKGTIKAKKSYRFGSSSEPQNTKQSGHIRFYASMSSWNDKNMIPKKTDYLGQVPWKYDMKK